MRRTLNPAWLVSLLNQWAIHSLRSETGGLGYASGSGWMRGLKSSPASSVDPTGYSARDFRDIDACVESLRVSDRPLWASVTMYYMPWKIDAMKGEGWPHNNSTFYSRLERGHAELVWLMDGRREEKQLVAQQVE